MSGCWICVVLRLFLWHLSSWAIWAPRSITIDHARPEGAALLRELAASSDVFIENFRGGVLAKHGPYARRPGYDAVFQAMSGMTSVSGIPDGEPGAGPIRMSETPIDRYVAPPVLGADTAEILTDVLGKSPNEIEDLVPTEVV